MAKTLQVASKDSLIASPDVAEMTLEEQYNQLVAEIGDISAHPHEHANYPRTLDQMLGYRGRLINLRERAQAQQPQTRLADGKTS